MRSSPPDPLSLADVNNAGDQSPRRRAGRRRGHAKAFGLMPTGLCGYAERRREAVRRPLSLSLSLGHILLVARDK